MTLTVERRGALVLGGVALSSRMIYSALVDSPGLDNATWISILLAGVCSFPVALALKLIRRAYPHQPPEQALERAVGKPLLKLWAALMLLYSVFDAACTLQALSGSASYFALNSTPMWVVISVTLVTVFLGSWCGANAVCGMAQLWVRLLPFMLLIVVWIQLPYLKPNWLLPVLGPGPTVIWHYTKPLAGYLTVIAALWFMVSNKDDEKGNSMLWVLLISCVSALLIALLASMMAPPMPAAPNTRGFRLDVLCSNGRAGLSPQLPLMLLSFGNLVLTVSLSLLLASRMLYLLFPKFQESICLMVVSAACLLLALLGMAVREAVWMIDFYRYLAFGVPALVFAPIAQIKSRRKAHE